MEARYSLTVFDIDKKKKDIAIRQGAIPAISAADVTKNSDYIIYRFLRVRLLKL